MDPQERAATCKVAGLVRQHMSSGQACIQEATPGTPLRHERDEIKGYIREVFGVR